MPQRCTVCTGISIYPCLLLFLVRGNFTFCEDVGRSEIRGGAGIRHLPRLTVSLANVQHSKNAAVTVDVAGAGAVAVSVVVVVVAIAVSVAVAVDCGCFWWIAIVSCCSSWVAWRSQAVCPKDFSFRLGSIRFSGRMASEFFHRGSFKAVATPSCRCKLVQPSQGEDAS